MKKHISFSTIITLFGLIVLMVFLLFILIQFLTLLNDFTTNQLAKPIKEFCINNNVSYNGNLHECYYLDNKNRYHAYKIVAVNDTTFYIVSEDK